MAMLITASAQTLCGKPVLTAAAACRHRQAEPGEGCDTDLPLLPGPPGRSSQAAGTTSETKATPPDKGYIRLQAAHTTSHACLLRITVTSRVDVCKPCPAHACQIQQGSLCAQMSAYRMQWAHSKALWLLTSLQCVQGVVDKLKSLAPVAAFVTSKQACPDMKFWPAGTAEMTIRGLYGSPHPFVEATEAVTERSPACVCRGTSTWRSVARGCTWPQSCKAW